MPAPKGQKTFAQGAAKKFEDMPKFEQSKGSGPKKLALPEPPKEVGKLHSYDLPWDSMAISVHAQILSFIQGLGVCAQRLAGGG